MFLLILWFLFSLLLLLFLCIIARIYTHSNSFLRIYTYFFKKKRGGPAAPLLRESQAFGILPPPSHYVQRRRVKDP